MKIIALIKVFLIKDRIIFINTQKLKNKEINPKFTEIFNVLNNEIKNKKENNNFNREENDESDSSYKWPIKIDINIDDVIDIFLNDKFGKEEIKERNINKIC